MSSRLPVDAVDGPDLVVAGAGGGLVAALRAAQCGLSVLVVESNQRFRRGNNTSMSTAMIPAAGTRWQSEFGTVDSVENFIADIRNKTHGEADETLSRALVGVSSRLVEWIADDLQIPLSLVTDFQYPGHTQLRCHTVPGRAGRVLLDSIINRVSDSPLIDMLVPARLIDVIRTDGAVSSVVISTPAGEEEIPTRAVLLAMNGFGANAQLVAAELPEIASASYFGSEASRGDALLIGRKLGADSAFMDAYQGHAALAAPGATLAGWATVMHGGFLVDCTGRRYGNETIGYSEYAAESLRHANGRSWIIIDERIAAACRSFTDFRNTESTGGITWAADAARLAEATGIDRAGLDRSLKSVREVAVGNAVDEFGRSFVEQPLSGRLGAIFVTPALFHTQGGLRVDADARVIDSVGVAITGLYASGGAAMGISGHGAGGYLAGNGLLCALGLAFLAAEHVARMHSESFR